MKDTLTFLKLKQVEVPENGLMASFMVPVLGPPSHFLLALAVGLEQVTVLVFVGCGSVSAGYYG